MRGTRRFARFNLVGLAGIGVQIGALTVMTAAGLHYLPATGLAVVLALAHNFAWHAVWTWGDRPVRGRKKLAVFARFAGSNGAVSLAGSLALMPVLVGGAALPVPVASLAAVAACGLVNYWLADRWCFETARESPLPCDALARSTRT